MYSKAPKIDLSENHLTFQLLPDLKEVCRPFFEKTGLSHFCYAHFDFKKENVAVLTTTPRANRYAFANQCIPVGKELAPGLHYLPTARQSRKRMEFMRFFNLDQPLELIVEKAPQEIEYFRFGVRCHQEDKINFYMNHLQDLYQFSDLFKCQAKEMIALAERDTISIVGHNHLLKEVEQEAPKDLLTTQERICFDYLRQGYTAKMIAKQLRISHRTVEHHLAHMRAKLRVSSSKALLMSSELKI